MLQPHLTIMMRLTMPNTILNLESVHTAFMKWRKTKRSGEHIPAELWQQVEQLLGHYSRGTIQRKLHITTDQMRKRGLAPAKMTIQSPKKRKPTITQSPAFVSMAPAAYSDIHVANGNTVELVRGDGTTLRCQQLSNEQFVVLLQQFSGTL